MALKVSEVECNEFSEFIAREKNLASIVDTDLKDAKRRIKLCTPASAEPKPKKASKSK